MNRLHFHLQVIMLLQVHISNSLFFHERSHIELIPDSRVQESFGFSLAYQNRSFGNIVSGAPHSDRVGKVFNCPLNEVNNSRTIHCTEAVIDVNGLAPYDQDYAPSVKLNLGYSISATDDYFFTCAPLWTSVARSKYYIFGTCFVYNDTAYRYNGLLEQLGDNTEAKIPAKIVSGNGWRTLVDRDSDMLLIGKVSRLSDKSDLTYVSALDPLAPVTSFMTPTSNKDNVIFRFQKYRNLGIAMTAGKFFDKRTMYAISSMDTNTNKGVIHFMYTRISKREGIKKLYQLENTIRSKHVAVFDDKPPGYEAGSMFGVAMSSADLNLDGLDELLVGAPAWDDKEEGGYETGAVHIYLGGDLNHINDVKRRRLVLGNKEGSRFGAAIAASDIDGDNIPEIFVSAPYEDLGKGALYILSGFEINRAIMKTIGFSKIFISQLKLSQRIQNENFKAFGFSLQIVPDIDGNGCNELAVGSPESQNIMLLRCLPSLNVTVEAIHVGDQLVKEQDNSFTISVCVNVQNLHEVTFSATFIIKNKIMGNKVYIDNGQTELRMIVFGKDKIISKCAEIVVKLGDNEPGAYEFYTTVDIDEEKIMNMSDFDPSRALLSPYSKMSARVDVSRRCTGSDCEPNLSMDLTWSGGIIRNATDLSYDLGSSELLTASLVVTNEGNSSWKSCAVMSVSGATVAQIGCVEKMGQYTCYMSYPLKRFSKYPIDIKLNMSQPTNENEEIEIHALLYDYCNTDSIPKEKKWYMKLNFKTDDVELTGSSHDQTVSDTRIEDQREPTIKDAHEYWVENKGNVTWNIKALVNINEEPFITIYRVSSAFGDCTKEDLPPKQIFSCQLNLPPRSKAKVIASADIAKDKILEYLKDKKLSVQSKFSLFLYPSSTILTKSLSTSIIFQKEQSFAQNKGLIIFLAVLGAAIALGLIIFVLYKVNFFIRTEKTKLDVLKQEHIRRQSVKRSMSLGNDEAGLDIEIDDDSPFEIIDMTEPVLQEDEKPQSSK